MPDRGLSPAGIGGIVKARLVSAGLPADYASAHGLRAGFLTQTALDGAPIQAAMRLSLHRSMEQAMRYYDDVEITDKLRSDTKPIKAPFSDADHRAQTGLNHTIEGSHSPNYKRGTIVGRFRSHRQTQRFLFAHDQINLSFRPRRPTPLNLTPPRPGWRVLPLAENANELGA